MNGYIKKLVLWVSCICFLFVMFAGGCKRSSSQIVIRYAAWNLGKSSENGLERMMVKAFMEEHQNVRVEIDEAFVKNYNGAMKDSAAKKNIPDVFMYAGNPQADQNGWCMDLSELTAADSEWSNIPEVLRDSAQVKGRIVAIPTAMYFNGYFYNSRIFNENRIKLPYVGMSVKEFANGIKASTNIVKGRIGLGDESSICEWYPSAADSRYRWFSWDGGKFNLNSEAFKEGIKLAKSLNDGRYTYALLNDSDKKNLHGANDWEAWNAGSVAMKFDGTWSVSDYEKLPYNIGFAGIPGGRTCFVPDYMFISKNSQHPKEAYEFIKFMSAYSAEGFSMRLKLADQNGLEVSTLPMLKDVNILNRYFSRVKMRGIREAYSRINNGSYVEGTKVLPGYNMARWEYKTNISIGKEHDANIGNVLQNTVRGKLSIDDVADQLNYLANTCIQIYPQQLGN